MQSLRFKKLFLYLYVWLVDFIWGIFGSKTSFGGDIVHTARQIRFNSRVLHCSGFCPDNPNLLLCYTWIMIYTLKKCFLAVACWTWQVLLHRRM